MKMMVFIGIFFLVLILFSTFVSSEVICSSSRDCDDNLEYTRDRCINPREETSYCINEITKSDLFLLNAILERLEDIFNRLTSIENNQTRNITVTPNVSLNPNITVIENISLINQNEMTKRGNIIIKSDQGFNSAQGRNYSISLPNGNCSIYISTDHQAYFVNVSKGKLNHKMGMTCMGDCSLNAQIDDEYYMVYINSVYWQQTHSYMTLAYNCV